MNKQFLLQYNEKQNWLAQASCEAEMAKAQGWVTVIKDLTEEQLIMFYGIVDTLHTDKDRLNLKRLRRLVRVFKRFVINRDTYMRDRERYMIKIGLIS